MERALSADLERVASSMSNDEASFLNIQLLSNDSSLSDAHIRVCPEGQIIGDAVQAAAAAERVQPPECNDLALVPMQLACPLTRGTAGRSLPISSCYTGSAGSLSRSKHGVISPRPTRPFPSHFGRTAARTASYRVGQWLWLSARHCSTAQRCVLCDCGL